MERNCCSCKRGQIPDQPLDLLIFYTKYNRRSKTLALSFRKLLWIKETNTDGWKIIEVVMVPMKKTQERLSKPVKNDIAPKCIEKDLFAVFAGRLTTYMIRQQWLH